MSLSNLTSLSMVISRSIRVAANDTISLFFYGQVIFHCIQVWILGDDLWSQFTSTTSIPAPTCLESVEVFFFFKFKAETKFNLKALCCLATTCFFGLTSLHAPLGSFCFIVLVFSFLKCLIPASATAPKALSLWPPAHPCSHAVIFQIPNPSSLPRKAFPTPSHGVIAAVL